MAAASRSRLEARVSLLAISFAGDVVIAGDDVAIVGADVIAIVGDEVAIAGADVIAIVGDDASSTGMGGTGVKSGGRMRPSTPFCRGDFIARSAGFGSLCEPRWWTRKVQLQLLTSSLPWAAVAMIVHRAPT